MSAADVSKFPNLNDSHKLKLFLHPVDLLSSAASGSTEYPVTDLDILERSLVSVSDMLDRVLAYVRSVLAGEVKGDAAVGRYLMDAFGTSTEELEKGTFNSSLQVRSPLYRYISQADTLFPGHSYGILPRQSRSLTSRSILPPAPCHRCVDVQRYCCTVSLLSDLLHGVPERGVGIRIVFSNSAVEYPRVL